MYENPSGKICAAILLNLVVSAGSFAQTQLGTGFTYQGQLVLDGEPVNATADFQFRLWDADAAGNMIGNVISELDVLMVDGLFAVELDFGADAFDGDARWLQVGVRSPAGSGDYTTLSPRQPLTAAPYAIQTRGLLVEDSGNVGIATADAQGRLHVSSETDPEIQFENTGDTTGDRNISLNFRHANGAGGKINAVRRAGNQDGMELSFSTQPVGGALTERMTIDADGRVGIGTQDPAAALDVFGGIRSSPGSTAVDQAQELATTTAFPVDGELWQSFTAGKTGLLVELDVRQHFFTTADSGTLTIYEGEGTSGHVVFSGNVALIPGVEQWLTFPIATAPSLFAGEQYTFVLAVDAGELRLSAEGGDPYPAGHMDTAFFVPTFDLAFRTRVADGGVVVAGAFSGDGSGLTDLATPWKEIGNDIYTESAKVGVGPGISMGTLHATRSVNPFILYVENTGDTALDRNVNVDFRHADDVGARIRATRPSGSETGMDMTFSTQPVGGVLTERLTVDSTGNVGIGTTSPSSKLEVAGTVRAEAVNFQTDTTQLTAFHTSDLLTISNGSFITPISTSNVETLQSSGASGTFIDSFFLGAMPLIAPVHLPHGARVTKVTFHGYDNQPSQALTMAFVRSPLQSDSTQVIVFRTSSTSAGAYSQSATISETIDNSQYYYLITVVPTVEWVLGGGLAVNAVVLEYTFE